MTAKDSLNKDNQCLIPNKNIFQINSYILFLILLFWIKTTGISGSTYIISLRKAKRKASITGKDIVQALPETWRRVSKYGK